jgi:hypothetical protein
MSNQNQQAYWKTTVMRFFETMKVVKSDARMPAHLTDFGIYPGATSRPMVPG